MATQSPDSFWSLIERGDSGRIMKAYTELYASQQMLRDCLDGYMKAVDQMNKAAQDGINVHGAISNLIGYEDMSRCALEDSKPEDPDED